MPILNPKDQTSYTIDTSRRRFLSLATALSVSAVTVGLLSECRDPRSLTQESMKNILTDSKRERRTQVFSQSGEMLAHFYDLQIFIANIARSFTKTSNKSIGKDYEHALPLYNALMALESQNNHTEESPTGAAGLFQITENVYRDIAIGRPGQYRKRIKLLEPTDIKKLPDDLQKKLIDIQQESLGNTPLPELGNLLQKYEKNPFVNTLIAVLYHDILQDGIAREDQNYKKQGLWKRVSSSTENPRDMRLKKLETNIYILLQDVNRVQELNMRVAKGLSLSYSGQSVRILDKESAPVYIELIQTNPYLGNALLAILDYNGSSTLLPAFGIPEKYVETIIVMIMTIGILERNGSLQKYLHNISKDE